MKSILNMRFLMLVVLSVLSGFAVSASAAPGLVSARVLLPDGKPAVGAKIFYWSYANGLDVRKNEPAREVILVTDAKGMFSLNVVESKSSFNSYFIIDAAGCALQFNWPIVPGKEATIQLVRNTGLEGQVVGKQNEPVAGVEIVVTTSGAETCMPITFQQLDKISFPLVPVRSDANGKFRLRSVSLQGRPRLKLQARAVRDGHLWRGETTYYDLDRVERAQENKLVVQLEPTLTVRGRVLDALTNAPIENAVVFYSSSGNDEIRTDADGRFAINDIFMKYFGGLRVVIPKTNANLIFVARPSREVQRAGTTEELTIHAIPFADVSGIITNQTDDGALVFQVHVSLDQSQDAGSGWTQSVAGGTSVEVPNGKFSFRAPIGENHFGVYGGQNSSGFFGSVTGKKSVLQVPIDGLKELEIPVQKLPGFMVRFQLEAKDKTAEWPYISLYARTADGERALSFERLWFFPAEKWGDTMEIRVVDQHQKEILPWTKITADPKNWPMVIELPGK